VPSWAAMGDAPGMYVPSGNTVWQVDLAGMLFGVPALAACIFAVYRCDMWHFFVFTPTRGLEKYAMWCASTLALASIPLLLVVLPLYVAGANLYQCGDPRIHTTIAYLSDSVLVEWGAATCICLATLATSFLLMALREQAAHQFSHIECQRTSMSWSALIIIAGAWALMLLVFSIPTAMYALSTTLPGNNNLGLSEGILIVFHHSGAVFSYFIVTAVAPRAARSLITAVTGVVNPNRFFLLQSVRLITCVVVPALTVLICNNDCASFWLYFWSPCVNDPGRFDVTVSMQPNNKGFTYDYTNIATRYSVTEFKILTAMDYFLQFKYPYQIASHSDVCTPSLSAYMQQGGQCSRAVLTVLGELIFTKCLLATFAVPAISLMRSLPIGMRILQLLCRPLNKKEYRVVRYTLDGQLANIHMFLEYLLIVGFMVPMLVPVVAIALAMICAVHHTSVEKLGVPVREDVRPTLHFLYIARAVGIVIMIWFYVSNDLNGKWLVCFGMPIGAGGGDLMAWYLQRATHQRLSTLSTLTVPLLDPDEWGEYFKHDDVGLGGCSSDSESLAEFTENGVDSESQT